jgi:hypothetical protein
MRVKNEKELAKLGFAINPVDPDQAIKIADLPPADGKVGDQADHGDQSDHGGQPGDGGNAHANENDAPAVPQTKAPAKRKTKAPAERKTKAPAKRKTKGPPKRKTNDAKKCKNDTFDLEATTKEAVALCRDIEAKEKYVGGLYWELWQKLAAIKPNLPRVYEKYCDAKGIDKNKRKFARALGSYPTREEAARLPLQESYNQSPHQVALKQKKEKDAANQKAPAPPTGGKATRKATAARKLATNGGGPEVGRAVDDAQPKSPPKVTKGEMEQLAAFIKGVGGKQRALEILTMLAEGLLGI